jgi:hypothetical protein
MLFVETSKKTKLVKLRTGSSVPVISIAKRRFNTETTHNPSHAMLSNARRDQPAV